MTSVSRYFDIETDGAGHACMKVFLDGVALLRLPLTNKGTAFSYDERTALGIDGLLPPQVNSLAEQVERAYRAFVLAPTAIDKYQFLRALQERQEILFYALLERHLAEMMPIVYTPTVGEAVRRFSHLYQNARGLSLSPLNIERASELMAEPAPERSRTAWCWRLPPPSPNIPPERHLAAGRVYPPIDELREVSRHVAARVVRQALREGQAGSPPLDVEPLLREAFWRPEYLPVVKETR